MRIERLEEVVAGSGGDDRDSHHEQQSPALRARHATTSANAASDSSLLSSYQNPAYAAAGCLEAEALLFPGKEESTPRQPLLRRIAKRGRSLLWIPAAVALLIYTDILQVFHHSKYNVTATYLAALFFSQVVGTYVYILWYLPYIRKIDIDLRRWQSTLPQPIKYAAINGVLATVSFTVAIWPVYHLLSLVIQYVLFMGFVVLLSIF